MIKKQLLYASICLVLTAMVSCKKEYSFEGFPLESPVPLPDTIIVPPVSLPQCIECTDADIALETWHFNYQNAIVCGKVTASVITPERNGFTFFGPSSCSADTGLILTVFLNEVALNKNQQGVTTNDVMLEYYDNITPSDVLLSKHHSISFTIESYNHNTGIAKGFFQGNVYTSSNVPLPVTNGKFMIKFNL